jgi:molecular chaperone GrpE
LTSEAIEAVLADFRAWLHRVAAAGTAPADADGAASTAVDLHTLLGQFIALRHEVNLQTRASRTQLEQNAEALRQLSNALETLRAAPAAGEDSADEAVRPLLKTLVDVADALGLAAREVQRVGEALEPVLEQMTAVLEPATPPEPIPERHAPGSFWSRWLGQGRESLGPAEQLRQQRDEYQRRYQEAGNAARRAHQLLDSVLTGYAMSLQRVERALQQHGLEPIAAVGQPFDPEQMEVLEVVTDSGLPAGQVVEELRRGYLWRGRVFRFAQVRVAKS